MRKKILIGSMLVLTLLLLMPSIPAIQQKTIEAPYKSTIIPIIRFKSYIDINIDFSELNKPIPPGSWVVVPITVEYWTSIPEVFRRIPWPINILFLFRSFIIPRQEIFFDSSVTTGYIDVYFSRNPVFTLIYFAGEKSISSTHMIILIGENTPSNSYRINIDASCYDIGRLDGRKYSEAIEFTVGD